MSKSCRWQQMTEMQWGCQSRKSDDLLASRWLGESWCQVQRRTTIPSLGSAWFDADERGRRDVGWDNWKIISVIGFNARDLVNNKYSGWFWSDMIRLSLLSGRSLCKLASMDLKTREQNNEWWCSGCDIDIEEANARSMWKKVTCDLGFRVRLWIPCEIWEELVYSFLDFNFILTNLYMQKMIDLEDVINPHNNKITKPLTD